MAHTTANISLVLLVGERRRGLAHSLEAVRLARGLVGCLEQQLQVLVSFAR